eukprot:24091-Eustigmatos_ZCMA.PRE.1
MSAPWSSSTFTTAVRPPLHAMCRAVCEESSRRSTAAPCCNKYRTASACPLLAMSMSTVHPPSSARST